MNAAAKDAVDNVLKPFFTNRGVDYGSFSKSDSLITSGLVDSISFVNLLLELEAELNISLDFDNADVTDLVSIDGLYKIFAQG